MDYYFITSLAQTSVKTHYTLVKVTFNALVRDKLRQGRLLLLELT